MDFDPSAVPSCFTPFDTSALPASRADSLNRLQPAFCDSTLR